MANLTFRAAVKHESKIRMALVGPSGSGKTMTALKIATGLGGKIAAIDTEHRSMEKYADIFQFDVITPDSFHPQLCIDAIKAAEQADYSVFIVDSLSHFWIGKDGELELVDKAAKRSNSQSTFAAWRDVTPLHNQLVDTILSSRLHIIVTLRTKTEWVIETNERGKQAPRKVGLAPVMKSEIEYEFDVVGDLNQSNELIITKTRCPQLSGGVYPKAGEDVAAIITEWCKGEAAPEQPAKSVEPMKSAPQPSAASTRLAELVALAKANQVDEVDFKNFLRMSHNMGKLSDLTEEKAALVRTEIEDGSVKHWLAMQIMQTEGAGE